MTPHPVYSNYFINEHGQFFHKLGPVLVELQTKDEAITIATGDERHRLTLVQFLRDIGNARSKQ